VRQNKTEKYITNHRMFSTSGDISGVCFPRVVILVEKKLLNLAGVRVAQSSFMRDVI
jgi:hypothetical protein